VNVDEFVFSTQSRNHSSAPPLTAEAASLIEKETPALWATKVI
jgi:hypothetical protein